MNYKNKIFYVFIAFTITLSYLLGIFYFYDPAQLFKDRYTGYYIDDNRFFARKVIDTYKFDGVIIGTSMLEQSDPKELKIGKFINISMADSRFKERAVALEYLLKNKKVKHIITTFDGFGVPHYKNNFQIMYKENISTFDKFGLYINGFVPYKCYLTLSKSEKCIGSKHNFYDPVVANNGRIDYKFNNNDFKGIVIKEVGEYFNKDEVDYLYKNLLIFAKENPNITFHIIKPPYSALYYQGSNILSYKAYIKHYLNIFKDYKNINFYTFDDEDFIYNMNNYFSDKTHYKPWINSRINKSINEGINIITINNIDEYFDKFIKKIKNYDIKAYKEALKLNIKE